MTLIHTIVGTKLVQEELLSYGWVENVLSVAQLTTSKLLISSQLNVNIDITLIGWIRITSSCYVENVIKVRKIVSDTSDKILCRNCRHFEETNLSDALVWIQYYCAGYREYLEKLYYSCKRFDSL